MSSIPELERTPFIALVYRASRAFQHDMTEQAVRGGYTEIRASHNSVFGFLGWEGARTSEMAARAGVTKQSMGEAVREMVELGLLEMHPDPDDRRAKIVNYTEYGRRAAIAGTKHLIAMEQRFEEEFGADYETARDVLTRITRLLQEDDARDGHRD